MARSEIAIEAAPERVFALLSEPRHYADWVVGARRTTGGEGAWPGAGSTLRHESGAGVLSVLDDTEVLEAERPRRLVLRASLGLLGTLRVELVVEPHGRGTLVRMEELPLAGATVVVGPLIDALLEVRNVISLRRLKRLAEASSA